MPRGGKEYGGVLVHSAPAGITTACDAAHMEETKETLSAALHGDCLSPCGEHAGSAHVPAWNVRMTPCHECQALMNPTGFA